MTSPADSTQVVENRKCNIFAGSDIGYLKGINFFARSFRNVNTVTKVNKRNGISCMVWGKEDDDSVILAGCKSGDVIYYNTESEISKNVVLNHHQGLESKASLNNICAFDDRIVTAFNDGHVSINSFEIDEDSLIAMSAIDHLDTLSATNNLTKDTNLKTNLQCMDHNKFSKHLIATGGKENPMRLWDLNNLTTPVFKAKNVKNDWLSLRVPVWETKAKFCPDSEKIVTGNGHGKVRLYDPSCEQKRPVIEVQCEEEHPITALDIRPNADHTVFVGNTLGTCLMIDLRKKAVVKGFKGNKGGITDIKCHPKYPLFAACSVDRYVRCYDPDQKTSLLHSLYVNSSLNCILFSSDWEIKLEEEEELDEGNNRKAEKHAREEESDDGEDEVGEDLWNKMEVVQTKKKKLKKK